MYCPRCRQEYRDGFAECADCRIPLAAGPPPEMDVRHVLELESVLEVHDSFALSLAKAALEDAGIDYIVSGEDAGYLPGFHGASGIGSTPLWNCTYQLHVRPDSVTAARTILEALANPEPADQTGDESGPGE